VVPPRSHRRGHQFEVRGDHRRPSWSAGRASTDGARGSAHLRSSPCRRRVVEDRRERGSRRRRRPAGRFLPVSYILPRLFSPTSGIWWDFRRFIRVGLRRLSPSSTRVEKR
jgi:hypothetical protein